MKMTGAEIVLEVIKKQEIDKIFGYPGGAVIPLYDELYKQNDIKHIRTVHEQAAVHAADAYARGSGKVGVTLVTSGPGATNTITGIATAYLDSVPLVVITGQVPQMLMGKDAFQEVDITGITLSITKYNKIVKNIKELQSVLEKAFKVAASGRPGPVLIDIPKDVLVDTYEYKSVIFNKESENGEEFVDYLSVLEKIKKAKRPVIYAGGGINKAKAEDEFLEFVEKLKVPVVNSLMSLGTISRKNPLSLGMVGMHGFKIANQAIFRSDLVIAIGARFSDRVIGKSDKFAPKAEIIQMDIDRTEMDKNIETKFNIIGDIKLHLAKLNKSIDFEVNENWICELNEIDKKQICLDNDFHPKNIIEQVAKRIDTDSYVVTDVGQHQMWVAQYYPFSPKGKFITSGGLGTMGFGTGATIGTEAIGDKKTVFFTGDGSFRMSAMELITLKKNNMKPLIILFNNRALGMVRQWQALFTDGRYAETDTLEDMDYSKFAKYFGIKSAKVDSLDELKRVLNTFPINDEMVFIECFIGRDIGVYPIVPPGKSITEGITE